MDFTKQSPVILSFCPGIRGIERGLERVFREVRTATFVEVETFIVENLLAAMEAGVVAPAPIWSNLKTFDPKPFRGVIDGIIGGYPCFAAGTLVLTNKGYIAIEEIRIGDTVLTHLGRWREVNAIMSKENAPLQKVSSQGSPNIITTPEHPFYVRRKEQKWNNDIRQYRRDFGNPEWVESSNIRNHFTGQVLPGHKESNIPKQLWWVIGRYLADGWLQKSPSHKRKGRVNICCNRTEADYLESKLHEAGLAPYRSEESTTTRFAITRKFLYDILQDFGRYAHGKSLPGYVLELDRECARELLEGYISGDGSTEKNGERRVGTVSKSLAYSISLLAQRAYGVVATITEYNPSPTKTIGDRTVKQRKRWVIHLPTRNRSAFIEEDYGWKCVRESKSFGYGTVYNIGVEEDESYMVENCIVHNCQPFSVAGNRAGEDDPRHLWPFIRRHIEVIQPGWCFFENVAGHLTLGFDVVKRELEEMGYWVEAGIYTAEEVGAPHRRERLFILAVRLNVVDPESNGGAGVLRNILEKNASESESEEQHKNSSRQSEHAGSDDSLADTRLLRPQERQKLTAGIEQQSEGLEHTQSRQDGGLPDTVSQREGRRPTGGGSDDRRATELAHSNNNRLDGAQNGESLNQRSDRDTSGQNEFQQSERCSSDWTDEELADTSSARDEVRLSGQNERKEGFAGIANNNSTKHRFPAGQGIYQYEWEEPRTVESSVEYTIDGYNFTEDLHRAIGNSVVEQTAELAFRDLVRKMHDWFKFING